MDLTERERRILDELEHQLSTGTAGTKGSPELAPVRRSLRPRWTVAPAAILGILLLLAGIALGVVGAVLLGTLLIVWWLSPLILRLSRPAGRTLGKLFKDAPPSATI